MAAGCQTFTNCCYSLHINLILTALVLVPYAFLRGSPRAAKRKRRKERQAAVAAELKKSRQQRRAVEEEASKAEQAGSTPGSPTEPQVADEHREAGKNISEH